MFFKLLKVITSSEFLRKSIELAIQCGYTNLNEAIADQSMDEFILFIKYGNKLIVNE